MLDKIFIKGTMKSVLGLGITTTIGYGTLYYSFAILSSEIQNEFDWSKSFVFGIFSLGILLGGFFAPLVGKLLDNHGARTLMSSGSLLCAMGLIGLSCVYNEVEYIAAILFLEIVSTLVLYEAAFVAFAQLAGAHARTPITQITLMAGFASTIFWPLIGYLLTIMGWREVYIVLALFHILLAMPIHFLVLKKGLVVQNAQRINEPLNELIKLKNKYQKKVFIILAFVFSLIAIPVTVVQTHFLGLLSEFGFETVLAISLGALIGPAQVVARIVEMTFAKKASPLLSGILALSFMVVGLFLLLFSGYSIVFATLFMLLYGAGQGISSVIKGSIPLYIFGTSGYGRITGKLTLYRQIITALVPFGFALLLENFGAQISVFFLVVVTFIAVVLLTYLSKKLPQWSVKK